MRRVGGLVSFLVAAIWAFRYEALRSFLYEEGFNAMNSIGADALLHWGVPILLVAAGVWLFWKTGDGRGLADQLNLTSFSFWHVPFDDAARHVYEAGEKAGILDLMLLPTWKPETKLNHFKMLLLVDDRVRLFGEEPPSTKSRLIPKADLHHEIYPSENTPNALDHIIPSEHPLAFVNVTVPRSDLRQIIKIYLHEYVSEAKQLAKGKWS